MKMNRVKWLVETAMMLALLLCLQWVTGYIPKPVQQFITGSLVNCVLAVTVLLCGRASGITVALISPVFAAVLGIAPNYVVVPAIMAGNVVYVLLLKTIIGKDAKSAVKNALALAGSAAAKFAVLYVLVVQVICNLAADALLGQKLFGKVLLAKPMLTALPAMFTWPQLITALIGGAVALMILPVLRKALKR